MTRKLGIIMDPIERIKIAKDSSFAMMLAAQKRGWDSCPSRSVPAAEIERFVVDQIRHIGKDRRLVAETVRQARRVIDQQVDEVKHQRDAVRRDLRRLAGEIGADLSFSKTPDRAEALRGAGQQTTWTRYLRQ